MVIITNDKERNRFLKFMVVGIFGALVDFGTFNLLSGVVGINPVIASVISFSAAVCSNFLWNRYWTYPDSRSKHILHQLTQFALINIIGLGIRTPLFAWLAYWLPKEITILGLPKPFFLSAQFIGHNLALATAVLVVMFWNFFINRYWTYNDVK